MKVSDLTKETFDEKKVDLDELVKAQRPESIPESFTSVKNLKGTGSGTNHLYKNKWWLTWNGEPVVHLKNKVASVQCSVGEAAARKVRLNYYRTYGIPFGVQQFETVYVPQ